MSDKLPDKTCTRLLLIRNSKQQYPILIGSLLSNVIFCCTSFLRASSLKKSNRICGGTGNHTEETAHKINPTGSPGSFKFFLDEILISSPVLLDTLLHV